MIGGALAATATGAGPTVTLGDKMATLAASMNEAERANLKLLLGMAAGGFANAPIDSGVGADSMPFHVTIEAISKLQPHRHKVPLDGIVYRGRPEFVTDELLNRLRDEARELRPTAFRFDDHFVVSGAPVAAEVAFSAELNSFIGAQVDHVAPTARANYLYYDRAGLGIDPHVDNEAFALNAIMMLEHEPEGSPSALVVYPPHRSPKRIHLTSGEMIVLFADSVAHARERMQEGERVTIVAFGFRPI